MKLAGHRPLTVMITGDLWGQIEKPRSLSRLKYNKTKKVPLPGILAKGSRMFVIKDRKEMNSRSGKKPHRRFDPPPVSQRGEWGPLSTAEGADSALVSGCQEGAGCWLCWEHHSASRGRYSLQNVR